MSDLVRVLVNGQEVNVSSAWAQARNLEVLDGEATHNPDGTTRRPTRSGGRRLKPKTTVAKEAAAKKDAPASEEAAVIESAPTEKE